MIKECLEDPENPWNIDNVSDVEAYRRDALRLWDNDTEQGIEYRLHTRAFTMLSTAAIFYENNSFGADLRVKLEPGWDEGSKKLEDQFKQLIKEASN